MQKKEIKVLHIISSMGIGGAERQLLELIEENKSHGICQLVPNNIWGKKFLENKHRFFHLGMRRGFPDPRSIINLKKIIDVFEPQIIHTWMYHASLMEAILRKLGNNRNIPLIWGMRCSNMDTSYYSTQLKIVIKACKFLSSVPNIIISNSTAGDLFHKSLGFNGNNTKIIPNGINTKKFSPNFEYREELRKQWKIPLSIRVFLCVARVDPMKDHTTLLEAFTNVRNIFKDIILILVGNKTEAFDHVDGVIALGENYRLEKIYPAADFIISSSAFGEGFSNSIAEGMSAGLIPIATKVGDAESIINGHGFLVPCRDVKALSEAIKKVLEIDEKSLESRKCGVRNQIVERFSKSRMLKSYDKIYNDLINT